MSESEIKDEKDVSSTIQMKIGIVCAVLLAVDLMLIWFYDYVAILFNVLWCVVPIILLILFLLAFVKSFWWKSVWHKAMFGCGIVFFMLFAIYLVFQAPKLNCDPETMAKHYEKHKTGIEELYEYMNHVLADSTAINIEFDGDKLELFHVADANSDHFSNFWDEEARSKSDSLMSVVGLTEDEYNGIRTRLEKIGCIGIKFSQKHPETTEISFRRVGGGMYSYIISTQPFTDEEKAKILKEPSIVPYNDHVLFLYGGPAWGEDIFPQKDEYLKKHKPW